MEWFQRKRSRCAPLTTKPGVSGVLMGGVNVAAGGTSKFTMSERRKALALPSDDFTSWLHLRGPPDDRAKIKKAPLPSLLYPSLSRTLLPERPSVRAPRSDTCSNFPSPGRKTFRNPEGSFRNGNTFRAPERGSGQTWEREPVALLG